MNAAIAVGAVRSPRAGPDLGTADSGLRLLIGGASQRQLRWSLDPDAPDARALQPGELRLAIRWVELSTQHLLQATVAALRRGGREAADWQPVTAVGCGQVIETRVPGYRRGQWLRGPLHIGTHRVLRVLSMEGGACLATSAAGDPASTAQHFAWIPSPSATPAAVGQDAVEQAVLAMQDPGCIGPHSLRLSLCTGGAPEGRRVGHRGGPMQSLGGPQRQPGVSRPGCRGP